MIEDDAADHAFLDGRLMLREPRRGHRSGTDAVLLAAASRLSPGEHLIDVGAGAGAAGLSALCRVESATATLIERDAGMAALARFNVERNGFGSRVQVVEADIHASASRPEDQKTRGDVVVSNPPFFMPGAVRASMRPQRAASHVLDAGDHAGWMRRLFAFARPRGRVVVIHRPEALPDLLQGAAGRAALRVRAVHADPERPATRILVTALIGRRDPFAIDPPLVLNEPEGGFTSIAEDLHRGRCWL